MKQKIICISVIGLLLFTGVASFPTLANKLEKNTSVVKSEVESLGQYADITIYGFIRINVKVVPNENIKNKGYKYDMEFEFNDEYPFVAHGKIYRSTIRYHLPPLFYLRFRGHLISREGTIKVTVKILEEDQEEPGWYRTVQTEEKTGTFSGPFLSW
jgi:hypothetical protein